MSTKLSIQATGDAFLNTEDRIVETTVNTIAPKIAETHPSSLNPGTTADTINKTTAFTTKANSPKVTIVSGIVRKLKIGLIKVLTIPKTTAAKRAVVKVSTLNPGTT